MKQRVTSLTADKRPVRVYRPLIWAHMLTCVYLYGCRLLNRLDTLTWQQPLTNGSFWLRFHNVKAKPVNERDLGC